MANVPAPAPSPVSSLAQYAKFFAALGGAAVLVAGQLLGVTSVWYSVVVAVATALGVYATPNQK